MITSFKSKAASVIFVLSIITSIGIFILGVVKFIEGGNLPSRIGIGISIEGAIIALSSVVNYFLMNVVAMLAEALYIYIKKN